MTERTLGRFGVPINGTTTGMKQPKMKHRFRVLLTGFGEGGNAANPLTLETNTCTLPSVTFEEQVVHGYNSRAYYAGKYEWSTIDLVVRDIVDNSVIRQVAAQQQKQFDHFNQVGENAAASYKFTMQIQDMDGTVDGVLSEWYLEGCWLTNPQYGDRDMASSEAGIITLPIRFDNATLYIDDVPVLDPGSTSGLTALN